VNQLIKEALSLAEGEAEWLHSAAQNFERLATRLREEEKAEWDLLAAVYRERAQSVQGFAEKVRQSLVTDSSSQLRLQDGLD
jgi:hypothetical protein